MSQRGPAPVLATSLIRDSSIKQKRILGDQLLASAERILDQTGDERRWTNCRATGGVQAPQHAGDDPSNPATELSQHASDCGDRREPFKFCSPRTPARSCGGCDW